MESEHTPDPLIGQLLAGKYTIVERLGEGGMGCVYIGEQQLGTTARKVAVKTLHRHLSQDPQIKARFQRECGTVATLSHPNTIQVFDFGATDDGLLYIVMELVQGRSVADILEKDGPMLPERVEKILGQVVGSLEEAHSHGIVHRDLKPENVVLCNRAGQTDWVEVLDFGIAKRSSEHDPNEAKLTQQGMVLGTPPYMSPEQFTGKPIDSRSDIYSLGVMAYEMLSGKLPFEANTAWEWASAHMTQPPRPIDTHPLPHTVPQRMREAVERAMAKSPDERFASVKEFFDAFSGGGHTVVTGTSGVSAAGGVAGRAKTELGQPIAPSAFEAPVSAAAPAFAAGGAVVPPAPPRSHGGPASKTTGSNRGPLIGAAVVIGLLSVGALGFAVLGKGKGSDTPVTLDLSATTTAAPQADLTGGQPAADVPPTPSVAPLGDTPPLGGGGAEPQGGGGAKPSGGGTKPSGGGTKPSGGTTPSGVPTPGLPGKDPPVCAKARAAKGKFPPAVVSNLEKQCRDAGGKI